MSHFPKELKYTSSHEWLRHEDDGTMTIGITDFAQDQLGDLVYIDLPSAETKVSAGDEVVVLESVKTAADVYAPISGTIIEINEELQDAPAKVNQDPYGDGWLFRIQPKDESEIEELLTANSYQETLQDHE